MARNRPVGRPAPDRRSARRTLIFLLCALSLLALCGCTGPGHAPSPSRTVSSCGPRRVPAYSNHRSYPPAIPTLPLPGARIIGCFASIAQAAARGFPLPVPRGTLIVHGVFLLPTGAAMRAQCAAVARLLGIAIPCPGLLPSTVVAPLQLPSCGTVSNCAYVETTPPVSRVFIYDDGFAVPPGYHGVNGGPDGHIVLLAERAAEVRPAQNELLFCLDQPVIRRLTIDGDPATVAACPEGSYQTGGHVLVHWVHDAVLAGVSFHGVNATNIDLDLTVARHMTWVRPRRASRCCRP